MRNLSNRHLHLSELKSAPEKLTVGLDLGDKKTHFCALAADGEILCRGTFSTSAEAFDEEFSSLTESRVVLEVSTHSPWVARRLAELGHEVVVANARRVRLIAESDRKNDNIDAYTLARLARIDPTLLAPVNHRHPNAYPELAKLRARDLLVRTRTKLINCIRGIVKTSGGRLSKCTSRAFVTKVQSELPGQLAESLRPLFEVIDEINLQIARYENEVKKTAGERFPETQRLQQIDGVGPITALEYVLTIEDPCRFAKSRDVAAYLGLVPKQSQSGDRCPQLGITKGGNSSLRRLLVQCAHHVLGPFGKDCDIRRWGLRIAERGGKNAKKRAITAVARKLAVVLHRLWVSGDDYRPFRTTCEVEMISRN